MSSLGSLDPSLRWYQKFYVPQRFWQFLLLITGQLLIETLSTSFKYIIKYMLVAEDSFRIPYCNLSNPQMKPVSDSLYTWRPLDLLLLHVSYLWGQLIGCIPGGIICDRFGGKIPLLVAIAGSAFSYLAIPFLAYASKGNAKALLLPRFIQGISASFVEPALHALLVRWCPPPERSFACGIIYGAVIFSVATALWMTNGIAQLTNSWKPVYYVGSSLCLVWCVFWFFFGLNTYQECKRMKVEEREFMDELIGESVVLGKRKIPILHILRSAPIWSLVIMCVGQFWTWNILVLEIPLYLKFVYNYEYNGDYVRASIDYFIMGISIAIFGLMADKIIKRQKMTALTARKILVTFGSMGPPIFLISSTFLYCQIVEVNACLAVGIALLGCFFIGARTNMLELAPNFAGFTVSITSIMGIILGNIVPVLMYINTDLTNQAHWRTYFLIFAVARAIFDLPFMFLAETEVQYWDKVAYKHRKIDVADDEESTDSSGVVAQENRSESRTGRISSR